MYKNVFGKNQSKGGNSELNKGQQLLVLCATNHSDLVHIPIKLNEDIRNGYRVMECTRMFGKKTESKGHNLETKQGGGGSNYSYAEHIILT